MRKIIATAYDDFSEGRERVDLYPALVNSLRKISSFDGGGKLERLEDRVDKLAQFGSMMFEALLESGAISVERADHMMDFMGTGIEIGVQDED